jgi:hypothetical protein
MIIDQTFYALLNGSLHFPVSLALYAENLKMKIECKYSFGEYFCLFSCS